jgi:hypothetical protein
VVVFWIFTQKAVRSVQKSDWQTGVYQGWIVNRDLWNQRLRGINKKTSTVVMMTITSTSGTGKQGNV